MTVKITAALAKHATKPVWDSEVNGFCLWPYDGGARSFLLFYRVSGRLRQITIGAFPTWSVEAARLEAKALRRLIDQGHDPAQEKRERRKAPTIRDLIDRYITDHLPTKSRNRERDERRMLEEIGQHLGLDPKLPKSILAILRKCTERSPRVVDPFGPIALLPSPTRHSLSP
jgi:Arm domain-containing DNA-binding protein